MQEEVTQKTIALAVSATKMTGRVLAQAMRLYLQSRNNQSHEIPKGKQSLADLEKQNAALSSIEITNKNIGTFNRTAKKYKVEMPIVNAVDDILSGRLAPRDALATMMGRQLKQE